MFPRLVPFLQRFQRVRITNIIQPIQFQVRFKNADRPKIEWKKTKVCSKRKTKYYKLKTHKGAMAREVNAEEAISIGKIPVERRLIGERGYWLLAPREIDVDDYLVDEDTFVDEVPNIPYDQLANETNLKIQNTRNHLQRNDLVNALIAALEPCYQYDDLKLKSLDNVCSVITSVKTLDIPNVLKQLNSSQLDMLVKYIYKG
ncbi:hypothetical protein HK103_004114 [Boothiomyces macroporosus]|uniref:Actin-related protein 2/3 complex subunit 5 n=1 Tax=Boothiomyces macroporosus TaxID=261099 RepID=A0AAD5UH41_9FUNG|nr:hypothetical protein HK103_004114 [Boothiomyces macroporosus]